MAVENNLAGAGASSGNLFLFLSEILGRKVFDAGGAAVGKLGDLKVKLGDLYPKVVSIAVRPKRRRGLAEIGWAEVLALAPAGIRLKPGAETRLRPLEVAADEIMLRDELLDKQVVDTFGAKIERINDLQLLAVKDELRVVHADYGMRGLLRRLGWLGFVDRASAWLFAARPGEKMISWKYIQPLLSDSARKNLKLNVAARRIHELHPSDLADIIEDLDRANRSSIFRSLDLQTAAQTLEEVEDPRLQASLIQGAPDERASDILDEMAPDEATDLLADLPRATKESLMRKMERPSREAVEALLRYEEGTAGSLMTKDFLSLPKNGTIGDAIEAFRKTTHPLEAVSYIYVADADGRLAGVCTLRHLLICDGAIPMGEVMNPRLVTVSADERIGEVRSLFRKYKFLALPVVDAEGRLEGLITLKDIFQEEIEE
jgi:magnesium transporter